ncbi:unnamed protein product [Haemonchus placei]|uniref:Uncharacterized protein n=1 Tax=Haemonchus placei TaxID=6290 RepID=A0A0N4W579_HAEPC|nr:unnamed protein product [Haemonchus placei]
MLLLTKPGECEKRARSPMQGHYREAIRRRQYLMKYHTTPTADLYAKVDSVEISRKAWANANQAVRLKEKEATEEEEAKAAHFANFNEKLESRDGERYVHHLAKIRLHQAEEIVKFFSINVENGHLLTYRKQTLKRWRSISKTSHQSNLLIPLEDNGEGDQQGYEGDQIMESYWF